MQMTPASLAIHAGDIVHYRSLRMSRLVDQARRDIDEAIAKDLRIGVSFSGGKDSLVLLDLVRAALPNCPAAFFDSGLEYRQTYECVAAHACETIAPQRTMPEMLRSDGAYGHDGPEVGKYGPGPHAYGAFLVAEPAARFRHLHALDCTAIGLRAQESSGRAMNAATRGPLYLHQGAGQHNLCPLARWTTDDIWAWIAGRQLVYNAAYDRMAGAGVPRSMQRVSVLIGMKGARTQGRYHLLRCVDEALYYAILEEFPEIAAYR